MFFLKEELSIFHGVPTHLYWRMKIASIYRYEISYICLSEIFKKNETNDIYSIDHGLIFAHKMEARIYFILLLVLVFQEKK